MSWPATFWGRDLLITLFHLIHFIIALLCGAVTLYYHSKTEKQYRHLPYWSCVCFVLASYYLLKSLGAVGFGPPGQFDIVRSSFDITLSYYSSLLALFCAYALKLNRYLPAGPILLAFFGIPVFAYFWLIIANAISQDHQQALFSFTWPAAGISAFSLVLLYHQLAKRMDEFPIKYRSLAVWIFVGYAFVQREYTTVFSAEASLVKGLVYGFALVFKLAATAFFLATARHLSLPQVPAFTPDPEP